MRVPIDKALENKLCEDIGMFDEAQRQANFKAKMVRRILYGLQFPNSEEAWELNTIRAREYLRSIGYDILNPPTPPAAAKSEDAT